MVFTIKQLNQFDYCNIPLLKEPPNFYRIFTTDFQDFFQIFCQDFPITKLSQ